MNKWKSGSTEKRKSEAVERTLIRSIEGYLPQRFALPSGCSAFPSPQILFFNGGKCTDLTIWNQHGRIYWPGSVNISTITRCLSDLVRIAHLEVEVYQGNCATPSLGFELNRFCLATFSSLNRANPSSLKALCRQNGTRYVGMREDGLEFTVAIPHFTKYSFNVEPEKKPKSRISPNTNNDQVVLLPNSIPVRELENPVNNLPSQSVHINPIGSIMISILRQEERNESNEKIQSKVFEKICSLIDSDRVYFNKEIKPTGPLKTDELLSFENRYRRRCGKQQLRPTESNQLRLKQVLAGNGTIVTSKRYECAFQPFAEVISLSQSKATDASPLSQGSFFELLTQSVDFTPMIIARICNDHTYPFKVKRLLALCSILFQDNVHLAIGRNKILDYDIKFLESAKPNRLEMKIELFKNWLAWVANTDFASKLSKESYFTSNPKLSTALALRKPQDALNYLFVNNRYDEAEFLLNIEDPAYRASYSTHKSYILAPELQDMLSEDIYALSKRVNDWFLLVSMSVWYMKKRSTMESLEEAMRVVNVGNVKDLQLQFRLIQMFLFQNGKNSDIALFTPQNECLTLDVHSCLYLISNHFGLAEYEESLIAPESEEQHRKHLFSYYRYHNISKIVELCPHASLDIILHLVNTDKSLSKEEREVITKRIEKRSIRCDESGERNSLKLQTQGETLLGEGKLLEGLAKFFEMEKWSDSLFQKICQLVTQPQLLVNYKKSVILALSTLLSQRKQLFSDLLIILSVRNKLTSPQTLRLIEILSGQSRFSAYLGPAVRSFLLKALERIILEAIVHRSELFSHISKHEEVQRSIGQLFGERTECFARMEQAMSGL